MRHGRPTIPQDTECAQETRCRGWPDAAGWLLAESWSPRAPPQPPAPWNEMRTTLGGRGMCLGLGFSHKSPRAKNLRSSG